MKADCKLWLGSRDRDGYGHRKVGGKTVTVHCLAYEQEHGAVPAGLEIDRLCGVRNCYEVTHLEAVTHQENVSRGMAGKAQRAATHCKRGHEFNETNTWYDAKRNKRRCNPCAAMRQRRYRQEAQVA